MEFKRFETIICPIKVRVEDCIVTIYEVTKSKLIDGTVWYHVLVDIQWRGERSHRFSLDVRDVSDLRKKLLIEISKFKLMRMLRVKR